MRIIWIVTAVAGVLISGLAAYLLVRGDQPIAPWEIRLFACLWLIFSFVSILASVVTYNAVVTNSQFLLQVANRLTSLNTIIGKYTNTLNTVFAKLSGKLSSLEHVIGNQSTLVETFQSLLKKVIK